jgi:hypothetical protein
MKRLISWREWAWTPTSVDRSLVFHCQLQLSGIWIESGSLTHSLYIILHITAVYNPSFRLNTHSCKQLNAFQLRILVSLIFEHCCLNKHLHRMRLTISPVCASCRLEEEMGLHFVCVSPTLATLRTRIFGKPIMNASCRLLMLIDKPLTQISSTCTSTF